MLRDMDVPIVVSSALPAARGALWERAISPEGVNDELAPFLRMTVPPALRDMSPDDVVVGERLGRSWILLLGAIPIDYDDVTLAEVEPQRRFLERSSMASMQLWQHERIVEDEDEGSRVTDRVLFIPRRPLRWVPGIELVLALIVRAVLRHRHRRLRHYWRQASLPASTSGSP